MCSGGSSEFGTMRWADVAEENMAGSAAAATTSACLKSVTPRGDRATGHAARAVVRTALIGEHRLRQWLPFGNRSSHPAIFARRDDVSAVPDGLLRDFARTCGSRAVPCFRALPS